MTIDSDDFTNVCLAWCNAPHGSAELDYDNIVKFVDAHTASELQQLIDRNVKLNTELAISNETILRIEKQSTMAKRITYASIINDQTIRVTFATARDANIFYHTVKEK